MSPPCTCPAQTEGGQVLLFYRYFDNDPALPPEYASLANDPESLAEFHRDLATKLNLGGKFRIAKEGFNITCGGTTTAINTYIRTLTSHWSLSPIPLCTPTQIKAYFKPTPGCACAFNAHASIRVTSEITPLGITNYSPIWSSSFTPLLPAAFHALCEKGDIPIIDVRNHYESRIGYFVTGQGVVAVRPGVRRFSQWPAYVERHVIGDERGLWNGGRGREKSVATYCTGGIRCEKGGRWLAERLAERGGWRGDKGSGGEDGDGRNEVGDGDGDGDGRVYTLQGGIVAYQEWFSKEVAAGRKSAEESFFKGKNYVFDGRGAIATEGVDTQPVSQCWGCGKMEDRVVKCASEGCHLEIVVCQSCGIDDVACCLDCRSIKKEDDGKRRMCECERAREKGLWGDGGAKIKQTGKNVKMKENGTQS